MSVRVLVVGNSKTTRDLARAALRPLECEVITATSASLGLFLAQKNFPSLILCDAHTADESGLDLLHELQADHDLVGIPLILIAGSCDSVMARAAINAGAAKVLTAPFTRSELLEQALPFLTEIADHRAPETPE